MGIDRRLENEGLTINEDNHLGGRQSQKLMAKVINAVRKAEADFNSRLDQSNDRCQVAQERVVKLLEENQKLKAKLLHYQHKERIEECEGLNREDQKSLLRLTSAS